MSNSIAVLSFLIKYLNIPVSRFTIRDRLEGHPDFPSLLSISDCLNSWDVAHKIYQIRKENYDPAAMLFPFIAHSSVNGGQFLMVKEIKNGKVKFSDEYHVTNEITEDEFLQRWDGIILYAVSSENSGESNYKENVVKGWLNLLRMPFLLLTLLTGMTLMLINSTETQWHYFSLLGLKLTGIVVSVLLLVYSINTNNPFLQNLCTLGKKNNCNTILRSKASKITTWLNWSEVGMFYFTGTFLCLLFHPSSVPLLSWLNIACLPYTFYSIGYQIKIKNWCILCCTVQGLLWLEAVIFITSSPYTLPVLKSADIIFFLFPIALWSFIKPYLFESAQVKPLTKKLNKFKYNSDIFSHLLNSQPRYSIPDDLSPIILGNPAAKTVLTMVSNPFCGPCGLAHQTLDKWLKTRDDIKLNVLFATANHDRDAGTKVARHLHALSLSEDKGIIKEALNTWYGQGTKDYDTLVIQFPVSSDQITDTATEKQRAWCLKTEVTYTPLILINGYKLTEPYQLNDIEYLLS